MMKIGVNVSGLIICFVFGLVLNASAQVIKKCGTVAKTNEWIAAHPKLVEQWNKSKLELELKGMSKKCNCFNK